MDSLIAPNSLSVFELLVRVTILLSAALSLAWLARKKPARVRHLLWTLTFALLLALPGLSLLGPSWEVPIIPSIGRDPPAAPQEAPPVDGATNGFIPLPEPVPALPDAGSTPVPAQESVPPTRSIPLPLLLWGVGCAAVLASLVMGGVRFAGLGRAATPLDDPIRLRQVEAVRQQLGIRGDVRVVLSRRAATPMTGGLRRRVVLLPMSATLWTPERWTVVLTHEMIHLCRRDVLRQLMVRAGLALYWFHPLSWVAARLAATASEEACDEEVLALGTRPSEYATHLFRSPSRIRSRSFSRPSRSRTTQITPGSHVSSIRTARSAIPVVGPHLIPPYRNREKTASNGGKPRAVSRLPAYSVIVSKRPRSGFRG